MRAKIVQALKTCVKILTLIAVTFILGCIEEKNEYTINPDGSGKNRS